MHEALLKKFLNQPLFYLYELKCFPMVVSFCLFFQPGWRPYLKTIVDETASHTRRGQAQVMGT